MTKEQALQLKKGDIVQATEDVWDSRQDVYVQMGEDFEIEAVYRNNLILKPIDIVKFETDRIILPADKFEKVELIE